MPPTLTPADFTETFITELGFAGCIVHDLRGELPTGPGTWGQRDPSALRGACFHHMAGEHPSGRTLEQVEAIARYHCGPNHISKTGLPGIAYFALILGDGSVAITQDVRNRTWAQGFAPEAGDENAFYVAIGLLGDFTGPGNPGAHQPTFEQLASLHGVWRAAKVTWQWTDADAHLHAELGKPACPGTVVEGIVRAWRASTPKVRDLSTWLLRQQALLELRYKLPLHGADGDYGAETAAAVALFASDHKLPAPLPGVPWERAIETMMQAALATAAARPPPPARA